MLPSVFALSIPRKQQQPTRHKITCGLLDVLACKHCRKARKGAPTCCTSTTPEKEDKKTGKTKGKEKEKKKERSSGKSAARQSLALPGREQPDRKCYQRYLARSKDGGEYSSGRDSRRGQAEDSTRSSSNLQLSRRHSLSTSNIPDTLSVERSANSILKTSPGFAGRKQLASDSNLKKQAHFSESVSVIVHDLEGHQVLKDQIRLKEPVQTSTSGTGSRRVKDLDPSRLQEKPFELDTMDIEQSGGTSYLKVVVFLGEEFLNERIEIHTAKLGQCLVVVAYKLEPLGDGTDYFRRYMQKFRLLEAVDPYSIKATLLSRGYVKIKAPLLSTEDENDNIKTIGI